MAKFTKMSRLSPFFLKTLRRTSSFVQDMVKRDVRFPQHLSRLIERLATLKADLQETTTLRTFFSGRRV